MEDIRTGNSEVRTFLSSFCSLQKNGFTLLELLIVIFLLSLMLTVAIPSFTFMGENSVTSDSKRIASILRYLNDTAILRKEIYSMKIDFKDRVIDYSGPEGRRTERFDTIVSVNLQTKGAVKEGEIIIPFGPLGPSEAFSISLGDDENVREVTLNPLSGRVKIASSGLETAER